jgi:hypothetical protein
MPAPDKFDQFLSVIEKKSIAGLPSTLAVSPPPSQALGITYSTTAAGSIVRFR